MNSIITPLQPQSHSKTNADLMVRRKASLPSGLGQGFEIFVQRAKGAEIWDVQERRYIDFAGGIAVMNTGHSHPTLLAALQRQLTRFTHTCFQVLAYESYIELAEKLIAKAPGAFAKKCFFMSTGAEAVENAIKVARAYTKRSGVISFGGAFHGRTLMGMALTGKVVPYKVGFGPFPAEIYHARFPNALHGVSVQDALDSIQAIFKNDIEPARVAAIILEPVQGEGGFYVAPPKFALALRQLCDTHGIVLIADEVQTGAGRTGTWLACEQWGVQPDIITMAKSMAGGLPLSAILGRAEIMDAPAVGGLGGTYAGNPLACASALAVLEVFEQEKLLDRSKIIGQRIRDHLLKLQQKFPAFIADVRGLGAMVAFELCKDGDPHQPDPDLTKRLALQAQKHGLIILTCGVYANVVRILVPLVVTDEVLDEGLNLLSQSLQAAITN
jgi:4-aminobutyrate aminotransferase / (S)-3-amino-2-methylpropionate transaminase / 5-aminovalerate transaminase